MVSFLATQDVKPIYCSVDTLERRDSAKDRTPT
jgi:hypothetical protein